jgi:hypothetical protein
MIIAIGCLLSCATLTIAGEDSEKPSRPDERSLQFRGEQFELAFVHEDGDGAQKQLINEYVPPGQTLDRWTKLVGVYQFPNQHDHRAMAGGLVNVLKQRHPTANYAIHSSEDGKRTMVDFLVWNTDPRLAEFNIFIYEQAADGRGVVAQQVALRGYGEQTAEFLVELKGLRPRMLRDAGDFTFPPIRSTAVSAPAADQPSTRRQ